MKNLSMILIVTSAVLGLIFLFLVIRFFYNKDLSSSLKGPNLYYKGSSNELRLNQLMEKAANDGDIYKMRRGISGERNLLYSLEQSDIPMYILYDINLKCGIKKSQIDFIVVTRSNIYVLESKNNKYDSYVDEDGTYNIKTRYGSKRPAKSPTSQNENHEIIVKSILKQEKIRSTIKSLVVMTNDNSNINMKKALKEEKEKYVRVDQLIRTIKTNDKKKLFCMRENKIKKICNTLLKYIVEPEDVNYEKNNDTLKEDLKKYRTSKSMNEGVKPYFIFNDETMDEIILKRPNSKDELLNIKGFSNYKVDKYGDDILEIINK